MGGKPSLIQSTEEIKATRPRRNAVFTTTNVNKQIFEIFEVKKDIPKKVIKSQFSNERVNELVKLCKTELNPTQVRICYLKLPTNVAEIIYTFDPGIIIFKGKSESIMRHCLLFDEILETRAMSKDLTIINRLVDKRNNLVKWNDLQTKFGATSLNGMIQIGKLVYMTKIQNENQTLIVSEISEDLKPRPIRNFKRTRKWPKMNYKSMNNKVCYPKIDLK